MARHGYAEALALPRRPGGERPHRENGGLLKGSRDEAGPARRSSVILRGRGCPKSARSFLDSSHYGCSFLRFQQRRRKLQGLSKE